MRQRERCPFAVIAGLDRQSMRQARLIDVAAFVLGDSAWTTGSSPVVTLKRG
jgi:hypothetical protein